MVLRVPCDANGKIVPDENGQIRYTDPELNSYVSYKIKVEGGGGKVFPDHRLVPAGGGSPTVSIFPDPGYELDSVVSLSSGALPEGEITDGGIGGAGGVGSIGSRIVVSAETIVVRFKKTVLPMSDGAWTEDVTSIEGGYNYYVASSISKSGNTLSFSYYRNDGAGNWFASDPISVTLKTKNAIGAMTGTYTGQARFRQRSGWSVDAWYQPVVVTISVYVSPDGTGHANATASFIDPESPGAALGTFIKQ